MYRLYSFVANNYLSPMQCGLQTAHIVAELSNMLYGHNIYNDWSKIDKTIIICGAGNHAGVLDAQSTITPYAELLGLPSALFREDEASMNFMATAFGVIVPEKFWGTKLDVESGNFYSSIIDSQGKTTNLEFDFGSIEYNFISKIKSYRLA